MNSTIKNTFSRSELSKLQEQFANECAEQDCRLQVAERIGEIRSFGDIKMMFESLIPSLLGKPNGKRLINAYTRTIKENKSLKTLYGIYDGINENTDSNKRRVFMQEALGLCENFDNVQYLEGMRSLSKLISESMRELSPSLVLEKTNLQNTDKCVNESILYLVSNKKTLKNLNDYTRHMEIVTECKAPAVTPSFNANEDIASVLESFKAEKENNPSAILGIFESDNKEETFLNMKQQCLEAIQKQKKSSQDSVTLRKLTEMEKKLEAKTYCFESYTKDMINMTDLQSVLN